VRHQVLHQRHRGPEIEIRQLVTPEHRAEEMDVQLTPPPGRQQPLPLGRDRRPVPMIAEQPAATSNPCVSAMARRTDRSPCS
jgi:hypothetical protein